MALVNKEDMNSFDDTEFVIGSDPSGMPPGMKADEAESDEVEIDLEEDEAPAPKKEAKKPVEEDDDIEIEIVDDAPKADQGREPLPDEVKEELEQIDPEEYSAKVKNRIDQLKKAWHDERREKEAAAREREEAARITKSLMEERDKLRRQLAEGEKWAMEQAKQRAELQLQAAKAQYRQAYDSGDVDQMAAAQEMLSRATYQNDQYTQMSPRFALQESNEGVNSNQQQAEPQRTEQFTPPRPDAKAESWGAKNEWFGQDDEMTSFALGLHQKLVREGVPPTTDEYYERIDARMREVFKSYFGTPEVAEEEPPKTEKRRPTTNVAPAGRTTKGKKVALTRSQQAMARKLGLTDKQYAHEVEKLRAQES